MEAVRIADGLWRWTAPHPNWENWPDHEREPREVGCVYYEAEDATVLIDPLVPAGEEDDFFRHLDADVERRGLPVVILLTAEWHRRSADELAARYDARIGGAPPAGVEEIRDRGSGRAAGRLLHPRRTRRSSSAEIFAVDVDGELSSAAALRSSARTSSRRRSTASWSCRSSGSSSRTASPSSRTRRRGWRRR